MSQQINLYSPIFLGKKKYFSAATLLQGLALIAISMTAFYAYALYQVSALGTQAADLSKRLEIERARLVKVTVEFAPQQQSGALEEEIKLVETQLATNQKIAGAFKGGAVSATQCFSEFMRALARQSVNGLWLTGFDVNGSGSNMTISGRTLFPALVPVYLQRLNAEPALKGRQLVSLQMRQSGGESLLFDLSTLPALAPEAIAAKAEEEADSSRQSSVASSAPPASQTGQSAPATPAVLSGEKRP